VPQQLGHQSILLDHPHQFIDQVDHQVEWRLGDERPLDDAAAAQFDEPGDRRRRVHGEAGLVDAQLQPVVGNQPGDLAAQRPEIEQFQRQQRLAGPRRPAQQDAGAAEHQAGGMDRAASAHLRALGRVTVNMAPLRSVRFSAAMVPLWACTIWREIDRPSPE
jgi:hypothetical protein